MVASTPTTESVTFLFTDIEGSTRLWEKHPEAMGPAVAQHDALIRGAFEAHGGRVFKSLGDSVYAAFDEPSNAVAAALAAQRDLNQEPSPLPQPLRVRMAVHAGECEQRDGDYFGRPLNRTARLLAIGHGGQVLVSECVRDLSERDLPPGASLVPLGDHRLRDLALPERVYGLAHPDLPSLFPPLRSAGREDVPHNLPIPTTSFVGREREIGEVEAVVSRSRLVTLTGSGGCGKTRLALQAAGELADGFPDGVWFVELARLTDPRLVVEAVAEVLGVGEIAGEDRQRALSAFVRERSLLLVIDNCEHLLDACGHLVDALLRDGPGVRVVATSREALGVAGELVYRVPSLSLPEDGLEGDVLRFEAPRLFAERALLHRPDFAVDASNAAALVALCRRLDGIPLAIELAAARVRALSIQQIDARLDDRFRLLTGGSRAALPRQQTLRALVDWSHSLLTEVEKTALRRLGVFVGGWSLEAAEAVVAGNDVEEWEVLDLLASLVDKSLVQVDEGGETRYRLLETVRQYALEKLLAADDSAATRQAHLDFFLALAEEASPHLTGLDQDRWFARLKKEHDNMRAAWSGRAAKTGFASAARSTGSGTSRSSTARVSAASSRRWTILPPSSLRPPWRGSFLARGRSPIGWRTGGRKRSSRRASPSPARSPIRTWRDASSVTLGAIAVELRNFDAAREFCARRWTSTSA